MKTVYEIKAKNAMVGPGVWERVAEALVTGPDTAEEIFVSFAEYDGFKNYTVAATSTFEDDAAAAQGENAMEHYENWNDAKSSRYCSVFKLLERTLTDMDVEID